MCDDRDRIIEKIKKLLALADNNSSEAEAIAAALKAQKLIAEYDIAKDEIYTKESREVVEVDSSKYSRKQWRRRLAHTVAKNFRCQHLYCEVYDNEDHWKLKGKDKFIGYKQDAQAAKLVYDKLVEIGEARCKEAKQEAKIIYGTCEGVTATFLSGFITGVASELEKQSQALMIVTPKDVLDFVDNKYCDVKTEHIYFNPNDISVDYSDEGRIAGRDAVRAGRMEENNTHLLN